MTFTLPASIPTTVAAKPPVQSLSAHLSVDLTDAEKAEVGNAAGSAHLSMSAWARQIILMALRGGTR